MSIRVCNEPGCPELVEGASQCERHRKEHRRQVDKRRPSSSRRGYGRKWAKDVREPFLHYFPTCIDCGEPATVPDHDPIPRAELVRQGVADPDAFGFLRPRCESCHNRKTATRDGGFGR